MGPSAASRLPALRGGLLALLAAALFGLSTPLVQKLGQGFGPFTTAALLHADAVLALRLYGETMDRRVWADGLDGAGRWT